MNKFFYVIFMLVLLVLFGQDVKGQMEAEHSPKNQSEKLHSLKALSTTNDNTSYVTNISEYKDSVYCDVLVCGGGSAGVPAAVQSGRMGAKTILLEAGFQLGGNATTGGVNFPGLFHAWGKQIIAGIGWEWVEKTVQLDGGTLPDFSIPTGRWHWKHQVTVNCPLYSVIAEDLCLQANVELRYFETPFQIEKTEHSTVVKNDTDAKSTTESNKDIDAKKSIDVNSNTKRSEPEQKNIISKNDSTANSTLNRTSNNPTNGISDKSLNKTANWRVVTQSMGQVREIFCKEIIDCTGNGAAVALVGGKRMREESTQPGTFNYIIKTGIDLKKADKKEIQKRFSEAVKRGELKGSDARNGIISWLNNTATNYIEGADNSTGESRTKTNIRGRQSLLRMLRFVKTLPGGEKARLIEMSPETGVRETWRIQGRYIITVDDYRTGKVWDDSLAYAFYPIDLHFNKTGVQPAHLEEGTVATIPLRALLVNEIDHFLMAGRCISSDRLANSALRVQASCMSGGQAAGAAAALAAQNNIAPDKVNLKELKSILRQHKAIVP